MDYFELECAVELWAEEKEIFELDQVFRSPEEEEKFITFNGYPVKPFIVEEYMDGSVPAILATPDEIGWFDEGDVFEKATFSDKGDPYLEYPKNFYTLEDLELHKLINPERRVNYGMFFAK